MSHGRPCAAVAAVTAAALGLAFAAGAGGCGTSDPPPSTAPDTVPRPVAAAPAPDAAAGRPPAARTVRAPLLVSGLDDHGLPADPRVSLLARPGGPPVGTVPDATLVAVLHQRGTWFAVRAAEGPAAAGWVNDYYLRGTVHVVTPQGCGALAAGAPGDRATRRLSRNVQARMLALTVAHGRAWVRVRPLSGGGTGGWVQRDAVRELANATACEGAAARPR